MMGIINSTPDSFFIKSRVHQNQVVDVAGQMLSGGAVILDCGGQSTRPGAKPVERNEEADRVLPVIENIKKQFPDCWISIDTFYSDVAEAAVLAGADIINDVSAGDDDENMLKTVSKLKVPYIAMHKKGKPADMQDKPEYDNPVKEILDYFIIKKAEFEHHAIYDWIADPGFGFGKTLNHNFSILKNLGTFQLIGRPLMVGLSRKGMIQQTIGVSADQALNGTTALNMAALMKGANILRVHDVIEARQCIQLYLSLSQ